mgnify:FL=1
MMVIFIGSVHPSLLRKGERDGGISESYLLHKLKAATSTAEVGRMNGGALEDGPVAAEEDEAGDEQHCSVSEREPADAGAHLGDSASYAQLGRMLCASMSCPPKLIFKL